MIEAIIYDMDWVLIDSEFYWRQTIKEVFLEHKLELSKELAIQGKGMRIDESVELYMLRLGQDPKDKQIMVDAIMEGMIEAALSRINLMEWVVSSMKYFYNQWYKIAIASSAFDALIKTVVEKFNLHQFITLDYSAEHEDFGKPHPSVYLSCAEGLWIEPSKCLAIEDSINWMIAAKAAKMICFVCPDKNDFDNPGFSLSDKKISSLNELVNIDLSQY